MDMGKIRKAGLILIAAGLGTSAVIGVERAHSRVPFVRDCQGKDPGVWEWGEGADGCDARRYGSVSRIKFIFSDFVFDRTRATDVELRKTYVTNVHALLRDLASEYIKSRKPDAPEDEVAAFALAIEAVAHQETYWSHYRIGTNGGYKLSVGDRNISHGMMQINQRYHASKDQDRSFDIVGNVGFGIEHFYDEWEAAQGLKCINRVKKQTRQQTLENITRAAYSAYNGGPGAVCRWTNPKHPWAKNDINFFKKLKGREWNEFVRDENHKLNINYECVRSGDDFCAVAKERMGEFITSRPLLLEDGKTCVTTDGKSLHCAQDIRVFDCLAGLSEEVANAAPLKVKASDHQVMNMPQTAIENRLELCQKAFPEIASMGDVVTTNVAIAVKAEIGGRTIGFTRKGQSFQVLDVEVELDPARERHYRVRLNAKTEGWISAGTTATAAKTASVTRLAFASPAKGVVRYLPVKGEFVKVAKVDGTRLLAAPEVGNSRPATIQVIEKGAAVQVEDVQVFSAANEIWLKVKTPTASGYIYAGRTYPSSTVEQWVTVSQ